MTADELVEKVARELCSCAGFDPNEDFGSAKNPFMHWQMYVDDARAAIAIVVEACAKVAEAPVHDPDQWNRDGYVTQYQAKPCVAAAIRSHSHSSGATGVEL